MGQRMDTFESLKDLENSLRDLIEFILREKFGNTWQDRLNVSPDRRKAWLEKKKAETSSLRGKTLDDRLLYFSDFYDLRTILKAHWQDGFHGVFPELKWITHFLEEVERLRNAQAHGRGLLQHQKHLIVGISGEIRTQIMLYRGKRQDMDSYFPIIEAVSDSIGTVKVDPRRCGWDAKHPVRVGDSVEVRVSSTDPMGEPLEYSIGKIRSPEPQHWSPDSWAEIRFTEEDVGKSCDVLVRIRTKRKHHAYQEFDDETTLIYHVLPQFEASSTAS